MTRSHELDFAFPLPRGLHARPAAALRRFAQAFGAACRFHNVRNGRTADLGDLLSLIATDTGHGDPCRLVLVGPDAPAALKALEAYLGAGFLETDEAPAVAPGGSMGSVVRRLLEEDGAPWLAGVPLSPGVGRGRIVRIGGLDLEREPLTRREDDCEGEQEAFSEALRRVELDLREDRHQAEHGTTRRILEAHQAILQDRAWRASIARGICEQRLTARSAVVAAGRQWVEALDAADQPLLQERTADIRDLTGRLLRSLDGPRGQDPELPPGTPCIVVAPDLTLSQFLRLPLAQVAGLVVEACGPSSHLAILARTFGVPLVGGLALPPGGPAADGAATVDGQRGVVVLAPSPAFSRYLAIEQEAREVLARRMRATAARKSWTVDGHSLAILANIGLPEEAQNAVSCGAEGIGLFRTETLCLEDRVLVDEARQAEAYRRVLRAAAGQPVTLRLLDAGGDKPLPRLALPSEPNPFLGLRAVRWYPSRPDIVRVQVRAALAAASEGCLNLMVPMVSVREELAWVRTLVEEEASGMGVPTPTLGVMVEVPALALHMESVADLADFFCVGTNDLVQYLFAIDRGNPAVARPEFDWHPAILRLLDLVAREAARLGRPLSICGELASDPDLLPLLAGLGYRTLSVAPSAVPRMKRAVESLHLGRAERLAREVLAAPDAGTARERLNAFRLDVTPMPLVEPDLIVLEASCRTREEALKLLVERLHLTARTSHPDGVEEALWAREAMVSTAMGNGYAVPHCQTSALTHPSLALLRLAAPISWGGSEDEPVHTVLLLGLPGGEAEDLHLRIFAQLARRLMREDFRATLEGLSDPVAVAEFASRETQGLLASRP